MSWQLRMMTLVDRIILATGSRQGQTTLRNRALIQTGRGRAGVRQSTIGI